METKYDTNIVTDLIYTRVDPRAPKRLSHATVCELTCRAFVESINRLPVSSRFSAPTNPTYENVEIAEAFTTYLDSRKNCLESDPVSDAQMLHTCQWQADGDIGMLVETAQRWSRAKHSKHALEHARRQLLDVVDEVLGDAVDSK